MAYRFIHAADIHLDSPLRSLALRNSDLSEMVGNATRRAFVRIIDLCIEESVDALLIAGDLYDGEQTSMKTARFLAEQFRRLHEAGVATFIIRGNHDALSKITKELAFPETIKVFGHKAEASVIEMAGAAFPVVIHGLSFKDQHSPESLLGKYRPPTEGAVNIGLMHTSLGGAPGHDLYAPCSVADLHASGFRYWALGHIHKRAVHDGACTVVMPGMPQGRDINEAGVKSVSLVTIGDDRSIRVEERPMAVAQFERVAIDASAFGDMRELADAFSRALQHARSCVDAEQLVARLTVTGATPLAWHIRRDADLLLTEAEDRASVVGNCWIDKLEIDCHALDTKSAGSADPLSELRHLLSADVLASDAFAGEAAQIADELRTQLPQECRHLLGTNEMQASEILASLARDGADDVLARLQGSEQAGNS